jgi:hypothetical protein
LTVEPDRLLNSVIQPGSRLIGAQKDSVTQAEISGFARRPFMKEEKLEGFFWRAANGRQSYEIYRATSEFIYEAAKLLQQKYGFSAPKRPIVGLDEVMTECSKDGLKLLLGWDNWSGFYVLADSPEGDDLVNEFGKYLDSIIQRPEYEIYIHIW